MATQFDRKLWSLFAGGIILSYAIHFVVLLATEGWEGDFHDFAHARNDTQHISCYLFQRCFQGTIFERSD